ncbi:pseudouridine synthase [Methylomonas lenta]|uniref:pseudouridine synthase n=1 Tax=Methylomonas lenta TaxID=980561 RepID=UPI000A059103|nr:pseudouridine synthase [Methylomonas lenta]
MNVDPRFPNPFPPPFASSWGDDAFGLWTEIRLETAGGEPVVQSLRWIEPGTFWMGSPDDEPERRDDEGPQHQVTLSKGFWLADTACTQALWQAVMDANPSSFKNDPNQPVETVNWHQVQEFIQRLQKLLPSCQVDLPSEAEWEYACRAGTDTPFSFGANISPQQVNYDGNHPYAGGEKGEYREKTLPVKSLPANPWGLYEMHDNVWEWCKDGQRTYDQHAQVDPMGSLTGDEGPRVIRGGSWYDRARWARSALRFAYRPGFAGDFLGFRFCLRSIQPGQEPDSPAGSPGRVSGASPEADQRATLFDNPDTVTTTGQQGDRIQKILSDAGLGSRREIEDWIREGRIIVNGQPAQLGDHCLATDRVEIDGKLFDLTKIDSSTRVIMYYKSAGEIVSRMDPEERELVFDNLPQLLHARWVAVGHMEVDTEGLLLFTTNGKLADRLMRISQLNEQKYAVRVLGQVDETMIKRLQSGIVLEDGLAQFDTIQRKTDKAETSANQWFYVTLKNYRNKVVQRLFKSQGITVNRLIRIRLGNLELPKEMKTRTYIQLSADQVADLMESVGLQGTESDNFN